ncbi:MAG: TlpA family protein disulfide reductase [Actinomycetota bacterium]|nr:TlpA family protein disulfide reductase [Actinomycetota bacterium]
MSDRRVFVGSPRRHHPVRWVAGSIGVAMVALVAALAVSRPASETLAASPLIGRRAPEVRGPGVGGGSWQVSQFRGQWVLLNFLASWCVPCQEEMPDLGRFDAEHARNGDARVIGVRYDPADRNLERFLAIHRAAWPVIVDSAAVVAYGVSGIPESYLIDPQGVVRAKIVGRVDANQVDRVIARS